MAVDHTPSDNALLSAPSKDQRETLNRTPSHYNPLTTFDLPKGEQRHYQQQYADMYYTRLAKLKPAVVKVAADAWSELDIGGESPRQVERVLDVRQGDLCWVVGTCYMEMPLKPNVLDDIGKEHWIAAPPPRVKYVEDEGKEQMMLEDESGRLRLTGGVLSEVLLVTGAIIAVVGTENKDGDFEVIDIRVPDLPEQPQRWERDDGYSDLPRDKKPPPKSHPKGGKVAIVSGLSISGDAGDTLTLDLLLEYLLGESTGPDDQAETSTISHLIIAGNSLSNASPIPSRSALAAAAAKNRGAAKKYGYDSSAYNAAPTDRLDTFLANLLPSIPVTLLPGEHDPTSTSLPQPPIHAAMFPYSRAYMPHPSQPTSNEPHYFHPTTNPSTFDLSGHRFLGTSGQPLDDIYRYVHGDSRLEMMEAMLRWRLVAPTAPDTLWCYPFQDGDAFVMEECPHLFFVGNQPKFETGLVEGPGGERVRVVAVPGYRETGEVVVVDLESDELGVEVVRVEVFEGGGGRNEEMIERARRRYSMGEPLLLLLLEVVAGDIPHLHHDSQTTTPANAHQQTLSNVAGEGGGAEKAAAKAVYTIQHWQS
ncbi:DNA polymerase delta small subunit Cdc1 [Saxophila tyrrhenica]|uniref:DNA-directed DNA polymerase n=1 Tax=Saxophila tyrrhenica TaxID=1690608 RepID=A0AAV9PMR2_9PEZI|nr:DNA polymerase delta small subunit Cdc1 [Saxophila tyrrhenica]